MRLILDRPYRYTIKVNGGTVHGSEPFEVGDYRAQKLMARYPQLRVATVSDLGASAPEDALSAMSRPDLDAHAESLGVADPQKLPNKGAVIDAIRATEPAPVVGSGDVADVGTPENPMVLATDHEIPA